MISKALTKYLRVSPKKLRPIASLITNKKVDEAVFILLNTKKKGASMLKNVVESALANAKQIPEKNFEEGDLFVSRVMIDGGPALKRYRAMSMGRAGMIRKRTSHILVELDAKIKPKAPSTKTKKPAKAKVKTGKK